MSESPSYGRNSGFEWKLSNKLPQIMYPANTHFPKEKAQRVKNHWQIEKTPQTILQTLWNLSESFQTITSLPADVAGNPKYF